MKQKVQKKFFKNYFFVRRKKIVDRNSSRIEAADGKKNATEGRKRSKLGYLIRNKQQW